MYSIKNQTYPVVSALGSVLLLSFRLFLADSHSKNVSREFFVSFRDKGQFATRTFCQGMFCDEELLGNGECCASALSKCPRQRLASAERCPGTTEPRKIEGKYRFISQSWQHV